MYKELLPVGSIVRLIGGEKRLMVCGRIICQSESNEIYDYVGCLYPEGISSSDDMYFFNRDAIEDIYFIGFQDKEEMTYRQEILGKLGELEVVDGQIVPKVRGDI